MRGKNSKVPCPMCLQGVGRQRNTAPRPLWYISHYLIRHGLIGHATAIRQYGKHWDCEAFPVKAFVVGCIDTLLEEGYIRPGPANKIVEKMLNLKDGFDVAWEIQEGEPFDHLSALQSFRDRSNAWKTPLIPAECALCGQKRAAPMEVVLLRTEEVLCKKCQTLEDAENFELQLNLRAMGK